MGDNALFSISRYAIDPPEMPSTICLSFAEAVTIIVLFGGHHEESQFNVFWLIKYTYEGVILNVKVCRLPEQLNWDIHLRRAT